MRAIFDMYYFFVFLNLFSFNAFAYYYCGIFSVNYICRKRFKNIVSCIYDGVVVDCDVWGNKDIGC